MQNSQEIWLPVVGYEGIYEVSNFGRIKRFLISKERILSGSLQPHGYYTISLTIKDKKDKRYVHRLVAEHFLPNIESKKTVNHKNGIKADNNVENLEWATYRENNLHAFVNGLNTTIGSRLLGKKGELSHNFKKRNKRVSVKGIEYDCVSDAAISLKLTDGYLYQCLCGSVPNKPEIKYI